MITSHSKWIYLICIIWQRKFILLKQNLASVLTTWKNLILLEVRWRHNERKITEIVFFSFPKIIDCRNAVKSFFECCFSNWTVGTRFRIRLHDFAIRVGPWFWWLRGGMGPFHLLHLCSGRTRKHKCSQRLELKNAITKKSWVGLPVYRLFLLTYRTLWLSQLWICIPPIANENVFLWMRLHWVKTRKVEFRGSWTSTYNFELVTFFSYSEKEGNIKKISSYL